MTSMRRDSCLNLSSLEPEEKRLVARIDDLTRVAGQAGGRFTAFLNERQQFITREAARQHHLEGCLLYGGYPDAARQMLGVFPAWSEPDEAVFPIAVVSIFLPKGAEPSHRDVLGSLMSLQIKREAVGDILFSERRCDVFLQKGLVQPVLEDLRQIGGYGVRCEIGETREFVREDNFEPMRGTVHSLRMDALVSLLTGLAREKGAELIRSERVQCNYQVVRSLSGEFLPGDMITIRGYGKYKVDEIGSPTKKGRLPVLCSKYL